MTDLIAVHNGSHKRTTLRALEAAKKAAKGSAKSTIQDLITGLKSNPTTARGRHSQGASMAKRKKGGHKKAAKKKHNPTSHRRHTKRRHNPTSKGHTFKGVNFGSLAMRGAATAGGGLGQSFVARQAEKILPGLPSVVHQIIGTGLVAGAALWLGKGKGLAEDAAIGAISTGLTGVAREFMPGVFAGAEEDAYVAGYQDAADALNGTDDDRPMGALSFDDDMSGLDPDLSGLYVGAAPSLSRRPDYL
jgi:hypothetical protein